MNAATVRQDLARVTEDRAARAHDRLVGWTPDVVRAWQASPMVEATVEVWAYTAWVGQAFVFWSITSQAAHELGVTS